MKLNQLLLLCIIGLSTSLTAQVYSDLNLTVVPSNSNAISPGMSIGYYLNNSLGLGAFVQSQLGENPGRNQYNITKDIGFYYGAEFKGNTRSENNTGWIYKGRIGFGNYKYTSRYEGAKLRVNSFHEVFLGKYISKRFSFGLGWRQSTETSDVFEWAGGGRIDRIGVFDRIETDVYNDFFLSVAYMIGKTPQPTLQKSKAVAILNKLYLDFFVGKNLNFSDHNNNNNGHLDQFEIGFGFKITDDIGIGIGAFLSNDLNSFTEEELIPIAAMPIASVDSYHYSNRLGNLGFGLQLRATPGKWHYKVEIGNVAKIATYKSPILSSDPILINVYTHAYYEHIDTKTDGFNPYFNLHVGRTFWNALTLSAGYTYVPNINYTLYEDSSRARYHAPQIKLGFTLD